jgi:hypothetical protein
MWRGMALLTPSPPLAPTICSRRAGFSGGDGDRLLAPPAARGQGFDCGEVAGIGHPAEVLRSREERGERDLPPAASGRTRPVGTAGQFVEDVAVGHEECRGEGVGLALHLLQSPDVFAVHDEMAEFVGAVETGSGAVVLIGGKNHEPVGEGQLEGVTSAVPSGSRCRGHPDQGHRVAGRIGAGRPVPPYDLRLVTRGLRVRCFASGYRRIMPGSTVSSATPAISLPSRTGHCQMVAGHPSKQGANMDAETEPDRCVLCVITAAGHRRVSAAAARTAGVPEPGRADPGELLPDVAGRRAGRG